MQGQFIASLILLLLLFFLFVIELEFTSYVDYQLHSILCIYIIVIVCRCPPILTKIVRILLESIRSQ
jgi:hypothetical protein